MTDGASSALEVRFRGFYAAFNARDVETLLAAMTPDVDWANGMTGGRVHGRDAVRAYWAAQWAEIDPRVDPVRVTPRGDGEVVVDVHQVVRDRSGVVIADRMVQHVYRLRDGLVARMDIETGAG
ncbi:MAG TPA: nuclear transport factor 2 family protein [Gemmatimonadaceae bacterium]|nr:nuclear transport factor 2 family protein [Gemmatimonadaceae bacterium]